MSGCAPRLEALELAHKSWGVPPQKYRGEAWANHWTVGEKVEVTKGSVWEFPCGPRLGLTLLLLRTWVRSLAGELDPTVSSAAKEINKKSMLSEESGCGGQDSGGWGWEVEGCGEGGGKEHPFREGRVDTAPTPQGCSQA